MVERCPSPAGEVTKASVSDIVCQKWIAFADSALSVRAPATSVNNRTRALTFCSKEKKYFLQAILCSSSTSSAGYRLDPASIATEEVLRCSDVLQESRSYDGFDQLCTGSVPFKQGFLFASIKR